MSRDRYNQDILEAALDIHVDEIGEDPDTELDAQIATVQTLLSTGVVGLTDKAVDHLRGMLLVSYLDDEDLPPVVPTRYRETRELEVDQDGIALVQLTAAPAEKPAGDVHHWGEFAFVAAEMGGYGDATLVNPANGERLWVGRVFTPQGDEPMVSPYDALRKLIDAAEKHRFLG
jgi:hypothetical protein